uniref:Uncharacterized protein n=1 Tax=Arundo donax TaxID=35708 RepID=A0A0A8Z4F9_ARUDO
MFHAEIAACIPALRVAASLGMDTLFWNGMRQMWW